ncbi:MAG: inositol monophosphatase [Chloroflexota bacterium]|nr:inositol monophosphatase [Chloroflexota bacterium]
MNEPTYSQLLEVATGAARTAGMIALDGFRGELEIRSKGGTDIVTQFDTAAESATISYIKQRFPEHGFLGEEGGASHISGDELAYTWIIDPIDGTHNYAMELPFWCTSVAVTGSGDRVLAGAIFDPVHDEMFTASLGGGAYLNGTALHMPDVMNVSEAILSSDIGYEPDVARTMLLLAGYVQPRVRRLRLLGSAVLSLAYVAAGRFSSYYHLSLQPWDMAAASLLIREAGGVVTGWEGEPLGLHQGSAVASSRALHADLLVLLHEGSSADRI